MFSDIIVAKAEVAKLADASALGADDRKVVWVQIPPSAPSRKLQASGVRLAEFILTKEVLGD